MLRLPSVIFGDGHRHAVGDSRNRDKITAGGLAAGTLMALAPLDVIRSRGTPLYARLLSGHVCVVGIGAHRAAVGNYIPPTGRSKGERVSWAVYAIGTIGALNVLLVTAFWLIASNIAIAVIVLRTATDRSNLIRNWVISQTIVFLAWLPGLVAIYLAADPDPFRAHRWIPASTLEHIWSVIAAAYLYRASNVTTFVLLPTSVPWLGVALVGALLGAWRLKADAKLLSVFGLAAITMPLALAILSIFTPFWITRYLLWTARYVLANYADRYRLDRTIVSTTQDVSTTATHFASPQQRLWVVYGRTGQGTMAGADVYLQKWLAFGDPAFKVSFGNDIVAVRFDLRSTRSVSRQGQIK